MEFTPDHDGVFKSDETGKHFRYCASCGLPLRESKGPSADGDYGIVGEEVAPYLVAKSYHKGECIFEYALCEGCRMNMAEELSEESKQFLQRFFEERMNLAQRSKRLSRTTDVNAWMETCATCGKKRDEMESYSIAALFYQDSLMIDPYPVCFCSECEEEIQNNLSEETRRVWDDFVETNFDSPPANARDLPVSGRPIFM